MQVKIKCSNESAVTVTIDDVNKQTVLELKTLISSTLADTPVDSQRLIFAGKVMKDEEVLSTYKLQDGNTVHLVRGKKPAPAGQPTPQPTQPAQPAQENRSNTAPPPNPFAAMGGQNPFAFPGMGQPQAGFGDPNMMASMLNNPQVLASVSQMMANPAMMEMMMANNPMVTPEMRQMFQSEQFRSMMSNPQLIQAMLQSMGNPMMNPMMMNPMMNPMGNMAPQNTAPQATSPTTPGANVPVNPTNFPPLPMMNPALMSMLLGAQNPQQPAAQPAGNPEEIYQVQLKQLNDMGFYNPTENVRALQMTGGNVEAAIEWLFSRPQ